VSAVDCSYCPWLHCWEAKFLGYIGFTWLCSYRNLANLVLWLLTSLVVSLGSLFGWFCVCFLVSACETIPCRMRFIVSCSLTLTVGILNVCLYLLLSNWLSVKFVQFRMVRKNIQLSFFMPQAIGWFTIS